MRIGGPGLVPKKEPPKKRNIVSIGEVQPMPHHTKLLDFYTTEMLVRAATMARLKDLRHQRAELDEKINKLQEQLVPGSTSLG